MESDYTKAAVEILNKRVRPKFNEALKRVIMTEKKFEKAQDYLSGVRGAEVAINRLDKYIPHKTIFAIKIDGDHIFIDDELAKQIVNLAADYYEKKKAEFQKLFDAL